MYTQATYLSTKVGAYYFLYSVRFAWMRIKGILDRFRVLLLNIKYGGFIHLVSLSSNSLQEERFAF